MFAKEGKEREREEELQLPVYRISFSPSPGPTKSPHRLISQELKWIDSTVSLMVQAQVVQGMENNDLTKFEAVAVYRQFGPSTWGLSIANTEMLILNLTQERPIHKVTMQHFGK